MGWDVSVEDAGNLGSWMTSAAVTGGDALNSVSVAAKRVDELGLDFEGQTADAVKNYWTQVHGCMLSAIGAALTQLTASYAEYYNELAEIDGGAYARFVQDEIVAGMKKASDTSPIFTEVDGNMRGTLGSVSDIISVTEPSINEITAGLAAMAQDASDLEENVNSTEASGSSKAVAAGELITKAEDFLEQIESGSASGGMSYVPTEFFTTQTSKDLLSALDTFSASAYGNGEYVNKQISAMSNDVQVRAQTRFEDAKRASERQALLKVVAGIGVVVAGAACIVATAGAATPAVAMAGAALGGTTAVFGVSDAVEGVQDTYKAFTAQNWEDLNSRSFNFTRDIFFGGDEEKYKSFENGLITACALAAPVAKGTTAFAGALEAGGSLSGAALSGSGAAVRCYLSSKVMGAVDSQVINPVLSNLVGGGEIGELVVGIKDVAMGVRGLRKSMASHKNGEHVSVKETSQDVKDVKISSSKAEEGHLKFRVIGGEDATGNLSEERKPIVDGPYIKDGQPNGRPRLTGEKLRDFEQAVYNSQVDKDGVLRDPNTNERIDWKPGQSRQGVCDFGHIPNEEYRLAFTKYRSGEWSLEQLKEHEFNFKNFQIETISSNRSGRFEGSVR